MVVTADLTCAYKQKNYCMILSKRCLLLKELCFKLFVHCLLISSSGQTEQAACAQEYKILGKKILTGLKLLSLFYKCSDLYRIEITPLKIFALILAAFRVSCSKATLGLKV